jgi:hypothetical protein
MKRLFLFLVWAFPFGCSSGRTASVAMDAGQAATGGAPGTDAGAECASKSEKQCAFTNGCRAIRGSTDGNYGADAGWQYEGCIEAALGCASVVTCASPPDHPQTCMLFMNGCIPQGWTEVQHCFPGC